MTAWRASSRKASVELSKPFTLAVIAMPVWAGRWCHRNRAAHVAEWGARSPCMTQGTVPDFGDGTDAVTRSKRPEGTMLPGCAQAQLFSASCDYVRHVLLYLWFMTVYGNQIWNNTFLLWRAFCSAAATKLLVRRTCGAQDLPWQPELQLVQSEDENDPSNDFSELLRDHRGGGECAL